MKFTVDPWNNFCRVFEMPTQYPRGFISDPGKPVEMMMVDWFHPVPEIQQAAVSKEIWKREVGPLADQEKELDGDELAAKIIPFIESKCYAKSGRRYLVVCDFGLAFTIDKE